MAHDDPQPPHFFPETEEERSVFNEVWENGVRHAWWMMLLAAAGLPIDEGLDALWPPWILLFLPIAFLISNWLVSMRSYGIWRWYRRNDIDTANKVKEVHRLRAQGFGRAGLRIVGSSA